MKAYLLSFRFPGKNELFYKLVYAFTFEQAKTLLIADFRKKGLEPPAQDYISNETIEYTI